MGRIRANQAQSIRQGVLRLAGVVGFLLEIELPQCRMGTAQMVFVTNAC